MRIIVLAVLMCACQAAQDPENCQPPELNDGFFIPNSKSYKTGDKISYGCNTGLKPDLKTWWGEITCKNGEWSHTPRCINNTWCITTHVPNAKPDVLQAAAPGMYDFECDHGYWIEAESIAECASASWTLPECKRNPDFCAPPPRVNNGMITTPYRNIFENGQTLEYICARGYRLDGVKFNTCRRGTWSSNPSCVEVKCTDRPRVANARAAEELKVSYNHGDTVRFICSRGYKFEGTNNAQCEDGTWKLPVCKANCNQPSVDSGRPAERLKDFYNDGDTVRFTCNSPYEFEGTDTAQCEDGTWKLPVCKVKVKCTDQPYVYYAQATEGFKRSYNHGDTVRFTCPYPHEFEGTDTAWCEDGTWKLPVCKHPTWCSTPHVTNGRPENPSTVFYNDRAYVRVVCDSGYEIQYGSQASGQCFSGTWRLPVCVAQAGAPCPPPRVANAQPAQSLSTSYPSGRTVAFKCNRDYVFEGTDTAQCVSGTWKLPVCKRAAGGGGGEFLRPDQFGVLLPVSACESQPLIPNGDVTELPSGKELKVQCVRYYKLEGPQTVGCVKGEWTALPVCKPPCVVDGNRIYENPSDEYLPEGEEKTFYCTYYKTITVKCIKGKPIYGECKLFG